MKHLSRLSLWIVALLIGSGCDQIEALLGASATAEPTPVVSNVSRTGELVLTITGATEEYLPDGTPDAPEGSRWVVVNASIINSSRTSLEVLPASLSLLDEQGQRYAADAPDESLRPSLIGSMARAQESLRGLARFAVPLNVRVVSLEWCPDAACSERLVIDLPVSE